MFAWKKLFLMCSGCQLVPVISVEAPLWCFSTAWFGVCFSKESHVFILWNRALLQPLPLALSVPSLEVMPFVQGMWTLAECYIPMEKLPEYSVAGRLPVASPWGNAQLMASVCTEIKARQLQVLCSGDSKQHQLLTISQRRYNPE